MAWNRKFVVPIELKDGRSLATLADARVFIRSLPGRRRSSEEWLYADGLLSEAALGRGALRSATMHLKVALTTEGLI
jgi:hypothetical protein